MYSIKRWCFDSSAVCNTHVVLHQPTISNQNKALRQFKLKISRDEKNASVQAVNRVLRCICVWESVVCKVVKWTSPRSQSASNDWVFFSIFLLTMSTALSMNDSENALINNNYSESLFFRIFLHHFSLVFNTNT